MKSEDLIIEEESASDKSKPSLTFRIKRSILTKIVNWEKFERKTRKKMGSRHFKKQLLGKTLPQAYKKAAKAPVDENKVIFVEVRHAEITNSFKVIFDEITNHYDYAVHTHFLCHNKVSRGEYQRRCINAVEDIATAKYVFMNEGSNAISSIPLRPETKVIQLWHGCGAFKKFGFSTADLIFGDSRKEQLRFPYNKNYSLVTVSSPEVCWAYEEAMNLQDHKDVIVATGSSRTDVFYDKDFINGAYEHLWEIMPEAKGKQAILYAPTFRGRVAKATTPDMLNIKMFHDYLGDRYVLLFKHHPHVAHPPKIPVEYSHFAVNMGDSMTIEELLCVADICISDYSSLVFEYSLFERPLIFFAYDLSEYFDWRGFYYDYFELAPGPVVKTNFEMIDYIQNIDKRFDRKAVQDFRYKFMRSCDGHATQRILEYAFDDLEKHRKPCQKEEAYNTVPEAGDSRRPYFKEIIKFREYQAVAEPLYSKYCKEPVTAGSVAAFDINDTEIQYLLLKYASDNRPEFVFLKNGLEQAVEKIARAQYILIDHESTFLDSLNIRPETKVILLPPNAFPFIKFGKDTKAYRSGLKKEQYEIAPLYSSVDAVTACSSKTAQLFRKTVKDNAEMLEIGDIRSDLLFDREFKDQALQKLYTAYPDFKGRKIISYLPMGSGALEDSFVYEYLHTDYIFLKRFIADANQMKKTLVYYGDTIVNIIDTLSDYETLAVSDIVIGDFRSETFSFLATQKPVIQYCPDPKHELMRIETFMDVYDACPTAICSDTMDVVRSILQIEKYDYRKYNDIRMKYLSRGDGNSTKRLMELLK